MPERLTIGLDYRPALSRMTGVGRYLTGLVSGLTAIDRDNRYRLFSSSLRERPAVRDRPENFSLIDRRVPVRVLNAFWHRLAWPSMDLLAGGRLDLTHSATPLIAPTRRGKTVITLHDLYFLSHPEATRAEIRRDYGELVVENARRADAVIAVSEATAEDACERLALTREKITVIHHGLDAAFLPNAPELSARNEDREDGFFLAVATLEPRKNLPRLVEAVGALRRRGWEGQLLIAGGPGLDQERVEEAIAKHRLEGIVRRLGYVPPGRLPALYRRARVLVFPSLWEGFGLPLLEAMASELPILASDIAPHREVAGGAARYVPPEDSEALASEMERLWNDDALRADLARRGVARVERFTWEGAARKTRSLYEAVCGGGSAG